MPLIAHDLFIYIQTRHQKIGRARCLHHAECFTDSIDIDGIVANVEDAASRKAKKRLVRAVHYDIGSEGLGSMLRMRHV